MTVQRERVCRSSGTGYALSWHRLEIRAGPVLNPVELPPPRVLQVGLRPVLRVSAGFSEPPSFSAAFSADRRDPTAHAKALTTVDSQDCTFQYCQRYDAI